MTGSGSGRRSPPRVARPRARPRRFRRPVGPRLVLSPDGSYEAFLAEPDRYARPIDVDAAREIAERTVRSLELDTRAALDALTVTEHGGASQDGEQAETAVADFTAHFRQVYDGTPMARGGDGHVSVTLDPAGTVCSISDRTVAVVDAVEAAPSDGSEVDVDEALHRRGREPSAAEPLRRPQRLRAGRPAGHAGRLLPHRPRLSSPGRARGGRDPQQRLRDPQGRRGRSLGGAHTRSTLSACGPRSL